MAEKNNLFLNFDISKILEDMTIPGVDVTQLIATQQKNIAALTQANQLAYEGFQAVLRRQAEIIRDSIEETNKAAKEIIQRSTPQDRAILNTELAKEAFELSLSNAKELAEIIAKSNDEAFELLNRRYVQILDEIRDSIKKR